MMKKAILGAAALGAAMMGTPTAHAGSMTLTSPDIEENGTIKNDFVYNGFGCAGKNISPALNWTGVPDGTQSFAVTVFDPDAPTGSGWWHWILYDIAPNSTGLPQGVGSGGAPMPKNSRHGFSIHGRNDYGSDNYGGPCPPVGDKPHHYVFTVYALSVPHLDVPAGASPAAVGFQLNKTKLDSATFTAVYGRTK